MIRLKLRKIKYKLQDAFAEIPGPKKKTLLIYGGAVLVPLFLLAIFFWGEFSFNNLNNLKSALTSFNFEGAQDQASENQDSENKLNLRLISREDFLEKYAVQPSLFPSISKVYVTLNDILQSTDAAEVLLPARNWEVEFQDIEATSVLAIEFPTQRVLYGKNIFEIRPIASLTKLAAALVVSDVMPLDEVVTVPLEAIAADGDSAGLVAGEQLTVEDLLYAMLLESSNDAVYALKFHYETKTDGENFEVLMNAKSQELGITDTLFADPSGLSDENRSTAYGVAKTLYAAFKNPTIAKIMATPSYTARPSNKEITHFWVNNNALLDAETGVVGGKTGFTDEAGPSMAIIATAPNGSGHIVLVALNAENRVEALRQLHEWVQKAYIWN